MLLHGKLRMLLVVAGFAFAASPALAQCGKPCNVKAPAKVAAGKEVRSSAKTPCCDEGCKPGCCPDCAGCCPEGVAGAKAAMKTSGTGDCGAAKTAKRVDSKDARTSGCQPGCCEGCPPDCCPDSAPDCCPKAASAQKTAIKTGARGGCGAAKTAKQVSLGDGRSEGCKPGCRAKGKAAQTTAAKAVVGGCCGTAKTASKVSAQDERCGGCVPGCCDECPKNCCPVGTPGCCPDGAEGCGSKAGSTSGEVLAKVVSALLNPVQRPETSVRKPCCPSARDN